jgi:putative DNA primase/helicase
MMAKLIKLPAKREITEAFVWECLNAESQGDGHLYAELFRERFVYNASTGRWLEWDVLTWRDDLLSRSLAAVDTVANKYAEVLAPIEADFASLKRDKNTDKTDLAIKEAMVKKVTRQIKKLRNVAGRAACLEFAHTLPEGSLASSGDGLDQQPWLLATTNKVINLATGEIVKPRQDQWITKRAGVEWPDKGLDAPCPVWNKYLWETFESQPKIDFLQRWAGYCLTGDTSEQKFLQMAGDGRNGKGIFAEVLLTILGEYGGPIQSEMLLDQGHGKSASGPSPEIMSLYGRRLAVASETDEHRRFSPSRVKWITGNDTLIARAPHDRQEVSFRPSHKLMLLTNNKPSVAADDLAFWERLILLEFPFMFMDRCTEPHHKQRNYQLREQLEKEMPAILAWCVRGCLEYGRQRLNIPDVILDATRQYQRTEDIVQDWVEASCYVQDHNHLTPIVTPAAALYNHFSEWYEQNAGKKIPSANWFGRRLKKKFGGRWHKDSQGRAAYRGVYLK